MSRFTVKLRDLENQEQYLDISSPLLSADGHEPVGKHASDETPSPTGSDTTRLDIRITSPIRTKLHVQKHGVVVSANGTLSFDYERPCDRCGRNLTFTFKENINYLLREETHRRKTEAKEEKPKKRAKRTHSPDEEGPEPTEEDFDNANRLSPADLDDMTYHGETIDFEPFLYEAAALGIPMRTLCEMTGQKCTVDPKTLSRESAKGDDPRWAVLKQLKKS